MSDQQQTYISVMILKEGSADPLRDEEYFHIWDADRDQTLTALREGLKHAGFNPGRPRG